MIQIERVCRQQEFDSSDREKRLKCLFGVLLNIILVVSKQPVYLSMSGISLTCTLDDILPIPMLQPYNG